MIKRSFILVVFIFFVFVFVGCEQVGSNDYLIWRNSEDAEDLNGDRKIDEADYEIYLNSEDVSYDEWRTSEDAYDYNEDRKIDELDYELYLKELDFNDWLDSDDAEDLNEDRKIDMADYELFLSGLQTDYELWAESDDAADLNEDGTIDEADYALFLEDSEFAGTYTITNYTFSGSNFYIGEDMYLKDFGTHFEQITFVVDADGAISANIPATVIATMGDDFTYVIEGLNHMTLNRISQFVVGLDTYITIDGVEFNATLYLTENENGFSTSYIINFNEKTATVTFDLVKG